MAEDEAWESALRGIKADPPKPREALGDDEKRNLIKKLGKAAIRDIQAAEKEFGYKRVFFLFNSFDPQDVADIVANTFEGVASEKTPKKSKK